MYCSSCGKAVAQGLSYCNHCGAKISGPSGVNVSEAPALNPGLLVSAMAGTFILGLVAITMLIGVMKSVLDFNAGQILAFAMLSFLIMLFLEGVFLRLLFRRTGGSAAGDSLPAKRHATKELDAANARALPEPVPSVTENTTRTFDPIYTERTSK
ncbi:MAG: zinc ribbon domain-containing protein [Pyrinomonadaceae bacterium]